MKVLDENRLQSLFVDFQRGEHDKFGEIYKLTHNAVYSYAKSKLYNADEQALEDMCQEVYLAIWVNRDKYDSEKPFIPWLYGIAQHKLMDRLRSVYNKEIEVALDKVDIQDDFLIDDLLDSEVSKGELNRLIGLLSDGQQEVIRLYYIEGNTVKEIAEAMEVNPDTVSSQLHKGRKRLKLLILDAEEKSGVQFHSVVLLPLVNEFIRPKFKAPLKMSGRLLANISKATGISSFSGVTTIGGIAIMASTGKVIAATVAAAVVLVAGGTGCVKLYEDHQEAQQVMAYAEVAEPVESEADTYASEVDPVSEVEEASEADEDTSLADDTSTESSQRGDDELTPEEQAWVDAQLAEEPDLPDPPAAGGDTGFGPGGRPPGTTTEDGEHDVITGGTADNVWPGAGGSSSSGGDTGFGGNGELPPGFGTSGGEHNPNGGHGDIVNPWS